MSLEVADNLEPRLRRDLPHKPAYDFTALFWVAVCCVNMVEDTTNTAGDDSGAKGRRHEPMWRDEELIDVNHVKECTLNLYYKGRLSPSPAFERYLPMLERWRELHAEVRTEVLNRRRPAQMWMGGDGFTRVRIYDPIDTRPIERSTIRAAILDEA